MNKRIYSAVLFALAGVFASSVAANAAGAVHWGYSGDEGPAHWGELSHDYIACSTGRNQSPINLTAMIEGELPPLQVDYQVGGKEIVNNGHSIQVNYAPGSTISVEGHTFELKQFHFHTPSENTIENESFPMEAHFVHSDAEGNLAVIAVMYKEGRENAELAKAWAQMPTEKGEKQALTSAVDAGKLLPSKRDYYRFNGSLTTPPCSEGVRWYVIKAYDTASAEQIAKFSHLMHHPNNRPVQPVNARLIIE